MSQALKFLGEIYVFSVVNQLTLFLVYNQLHEVAVVGTVSSGISFGFKYAERKREYQHEMFKNETKQAFNLNKSLGKRLLKNF